MNTRIKVLFAATIMASFASPVIGQLYPIPGSFVSNQVTPPQPYQQFNSTTDLFKTYDYHSSHFVFEAVEGFIGFVQVVNVGSASYDIFTHSIDGDVQHSTANVAVGTETYHEIFWDDVTGEPFMHTSSRFIEPGMTQLAWLGFDPFGWYFQDSSVSGTQTGSAFINYTWAWSFSDMVLSTVNGQASDGTPLTEEVEEKTALCNVDFFWWAFNRFTFAPVRVPDFGDISYLPGIPNNGEYRRVRGSIFNPAFFP